MSTKKETKFDSLEDLKALNRMYPSLVISSLDQKRVDTFYNETTGIGTSRDKATLNKFWFNGFLSPQEVEILCTETIWQIIADALPQDATSEGFGIVIEKDDTQDLATEIQDRFDEMGLAEKVTQAAINARRYGWGALWLIPQGGADTHDQPLKDEEITSLDAVVVLERQDVQIVDWELDVTNPNCGEPNMYRVQNRIGNKQTAPVNVHASRLVVFHGPRLSKQLRHTNQGFHASALDAPYKIVEQHEIAWGCVGAVLQDAAQAVYKITGLFNMGAAQDRGVVQQRLKIIDQERSVTRAITLDKDKEDFERQEYSFTGYSQLIDKWGVRLAMAAQMPVTRLFGVSPAGLNATGESDLKTWEGKVKPYQKDNITPAWRRLISVLGGPQLKDRKWKINPNPLRQMDDTQIADIRKKYSEIDTAYINSQVYTPEEVAINRFGPRGWTSEMQIETKLREQILEIDQEKALEDAKNPPEPVAPGVDLSADPNAAPVKPADESAKA